MANDTIDTGLAGLAVTAAVTEDTPASLPAVVTTTMPDDWNIHKVAALVRDLAYHMYDVPIILKKHGLTDDQYKFLEQNVFFQRALEGAVLEWNNPQSTNRRLAMEAAILLEDALPSMGARLSKTNEPLPGVVTLASLFAKMAGIGENTQQGPAGEKFKITINLGADVFEREKDRAPKVAVDLQPLAEGIGTDAALQRLISAHGLPLPL